MSERSSEGDASHGLAPVRRAILSVSDKTGLVEFAEGLVDLGVEVISTGGTFRALESAGIRATAIERVTGFPEMMDGRVKTLHPAVHAGVLAVRTDAEHERSLSEQGIRLIDLVCVNLYPFEATVARRGVERDEAVEQIDIGGPAMLRSAAKNHAWVVAVTAPAQYQRVLEELQSLEGSTTLSLRRELAGAAFARTSAYDAAIARFLAEADEDGFPRVLAITGEKTGALRYGENPHQKAALYRDPAFIGPTIVGARTHGETALSYNNYADAAAALSVVRDLSRSMEDRVGACVIKHATPCGVAIAGDVPEAVDAALASDPVSAYGGIVAIRGEVDEPAADRLTREGAFLEVVVAESFTEEARARLLGRWKRVRLVEVGPIAREAGSETQFASIEGGVLVQRRDDLPPDPTKWVVAAGAAPTPEQLKAAAFLEVVCRAVMSNAIVIGGVSEGVASVFGVGGGQTDRVTACRLAVAKAGERAAGAIAVSDGFFPFSDGPEVLLDAGVQVLVQPGGSRRDGETFELCEARGAACLTTGIRRFRH